MLWKLIAAFIGTQAGSFIVIAHIAQTIAKNIIVKAMCWLAMVAAIVIPVLIAGQYTVIVLSSLVASAVFTVLALGFLSINRLEDDILEEGCSNVE